MGSTGTENFVILNDYDDIVKFEALVDTVTGGR